MTDIPQATNSLNSLGTYINRVIYKTTSYPTGSIPDPIDLWYDKSLYGKVDQNNNAIFLTESSLKQIKTNDFKQLFVLNFVADAFEDFKKHFKKAETSNRINQGSEFNNIQPTAGWKSAGVLYHTYMNILFENFVNVFIKDNNRKEKIRDFDSFLNIFIEYIDSVCPTFLFSRTAFIRSKYCAPEISGLIIQLKDENHSLDQEKFERFIQDNNFQFYVKTAMKFGFLVDKNAPWRLVADIASPAMTPYLKKYDLTTLDKVFTDLYFKSSNTDIDTLKVYIVQFYNSFVDKEPFLNLIKTAQIIKDESIVERFERKKITQNEIGMRFDYKFWNKLYIYIRIRETNLPISQAEFSRFVMTSNQIEKTLDTESAREYINRRFSSLPDLISHKISNIDFFV